MNVSVIIPSYNSADYLPATMQSVLAQTQPAREIIVVDDGSTDGTEAVCAAFHDRIRYEKRANAGVSAARNFGAEMAGGEWLLFLDSDDRLLPHALEALVAAARAQSCEVVYGHVLMRGKTAPEARLHGFPWAVGRHPLPAVRSFWRSPISTPGAALVSRSLFGKVGGFVPGYEPMEDRDFWIKCGTLADFGFCDTVVLDKTWREGSAGSQASKRILAGLRSGLDYFSWCAVRGIDTSFLQITARQVVEQALKDALHEKRRDVLPALLEKARELGPRGFWYYRALAEKLLVA